MRLLAAVLALGLWGAAMPVVAQTSGRRSAKVEKFIRAARRVGSSSQSAGAQASAGAFSWRSNTSAVKVWGSNGAVQISQSYLITASATGLTLQIWVDNTEVYNSDFDYRTTDFDGIKSAAVAARLRKVGTYGDMLCGGSSVSLSFEAGGNSYFEVSYESGMMDYKGDFDGIVDLITEQIPDFRSILDDNYDISPAGSDPDDEALYYGL